MTGHRYILCIDDDEDDCLLLGEAITKEDPSIEAEFIMSGDEAIQFLREALENNDLPALITLDINMPGMDGTETLTKMQELIGMKKIPVVFLTTHPGDEELFLAERNHISVMAKPRTASGYDDLAKTISYMLLK
ncbi:MAG: response regulator [Chitinophagales bacterium]